jgi:hypothetical protein
MDTVKIDTRRGTAERRAFNDPGALTYSFVLEPDIGLSEGLLTGTAYEVPMQRDVTTTHGPFGDVGWVITETALPATYMKYSADEALLSAVHRGNFLATVNPIVTLYDNILLFGGRPRRSLSTFTPVGRQRPATAVFPPGAVVSDLLRCLGLRRGWDGIRAEPVSTLTVERALTLLSNLYRRAHREHVHLRAPEVGPTADGTIQFEWDDPNTFLSIEVPAPREPLAFFLRQGRDGNESGEDKASVDQLWEAVKIGGVA